MPSCNPFSGLKAKLSKKKRTRNIPGAGTEPEPKSPKKDSPAPVASGLSVDEACPAKEEVSSPRSFEKQSPSRRGLPVKNRWQDAFNQLPSATQSKLKEMGFGSPMSGSVKSSIKDLVTEVNRKQAECEGNFWYVNVGGEKIVLREYTTQIVGWLQKAGDIAVQFAPPQASLPWDLVKSLMKIPVNESEQMGALLATTERVVRITSRGQVYENVYLPQELDAQLSSAQMNLETSLVGIYKTSLDLLAESGKLLSAGTARRTLEAIVNPSKATDSLSSLTAQEDEILRDVQACESQRSSDSDKRANAMLDALQAPMARVDEGLGRLLRHVSDSERLGLLEWISPIPFGKHHNTVRDARTPGTGDWLLQHEDFQSWETKRSSTLFWLQGNPGTGKTYLTSTVIDHIRDQMSKSSSDEGLAFFYCGRDETISKPLSLVQSFVRQLSTTANNSKFMQIGLEESCKRAKEAGTDFRFAQCKEQIFRSLNIYQRTTLVIDAMDECDPESRRELIEALQYFMSESKRVVRIFISSRPDPTIEYLLQCSPNIGIRAEDNQDDIRTFLQDKVEKLTKTAPFLKPLQSEIITKLLERCRSMFQWAALQVHQIAKCKSRAAVWERLERLPKGLTDAYDEAWEQIEGQDKFEQLITKRALLWVMSASHPMTSVEILAAIRMAPNGELLPLDYMVTEQSLLSLCNYFLAVDPQLKVWRFPHLSVREYLESKEGWSTSHAHYYAASASLCYFVNKYGHSDSDLDAKLDSLLETESNMPEDMDGRDKHLQSDDGFHTFHPFHIYMRHSWTHHINGTADIETANLSSLLKTFLGSPNESSLQYQRWHQNTSNDFERHLSSPNYEHYAINAEQFREICPGNAAVFSMCRFSLTTIVWDWWETAEIDITRVNSNNQSLLEIAVGAGCLPICEKLVQLLATRGADRGTKRQFFGRSLQVAASKGAKEMVQLLLDSGADVNAEEGFPDRTALQAATIKGHEQIVQILLDRGADVNIHGMYGTALQVALWKGDGPIAQMLLDRGADVNAHGGVLGNTVVAAAQGCDEDLFTLLLERGMDPIGEKHAQALVAAAERGSEKIVEILLDRGVNVNARDSRGTALQAASSNGHENLIQTLLDRGANIDAQGGMSGNALQSAAYNGHAKAVQILLERGADINAQGGDYGTALQSAVTGGHKEVIQILLDRGADIHAQGGEYGSALHAAVSIGHEEIIQILLDRGAAINAQGGEQGTALSRVVRALRGGDIKRHGTALQVASSAGFERVVQILLVRGADVNAQGGEYNTALQAASSEGHERIVRMLLDRGANINAYGGKYGTALQAALFNGYKKIAQMLLDRGANINDQGGEYGTALQAASARGSEEIIQILLDHGASVNIYGGKYGTALQAASSKGYEKVAQILLDRGADINAQGENGTALQAASAEGHERIVQMLLDRGANINAYGGNYGTALQAASARGSIGIVQILLDRGAEINYQGGEYGTALQAASAMGSGEIVQMLLDRGADINIQGENGTALQAASAEGHERIAQMLLDRGANVNAYGGKYGTALQAASARGSVEIVQMLLDQGADINAYGGKYGTALQAASAESLEKMVRVLVDPDLQRFTSVVKMLLDRGADVNAYGGEYGTALQAASARGSEEIVQILLDRGANVNIHGGKYGTALHAASVKHTDASLAIGESAKGHETVTQMLLDRGADVNSEAGRWGTPLQAASYKGNKEIVQILLNRGACVNVQAGERGSALQAASSRGHNEIVRMLRDRDTDAIIENKEPDP